MNPTDAILDVLMFEISSQFGGSGAFDEILFNFIGPIMGPIGLHGPINLNGLNFVSAMASTVLLVGYLLIVGRLYRIGSQNHSAKDHIKFIAMMLPCFLPPFIRLGIQIVQIVSRPGFELY